MDTKWPHLVKHTQRMAERLDAKVPERGPGEAFLDAQPADLWLELKRHLAQAEHAQARGDSVAALIALTDGGNYVAMLARVAEHDGEPFRPA
ncbi:hypothetical protein [Pyxidicoccus caerfyrddinensis]|uniref:hypothetical protein n=1 Tax=Pyxidicoccus caerfyrddinensis TaxID=2709663 RepID=UPI0013DAD9FC|nr:hypothetical protein [Pyxidicoccus caerfyrddinensis]